VDNSVSQGIPQSSWPSSKQSFVQKWLAIGKWLIFMAVFVCLEIWRPWIKNSMLWNCQRQKCLSAV